MDNYRRSILSRFRMKGDQMKSYWYHGDAIVLIACILFTRTIYSEGGGGSSGEILSAKRRVKWSDASVPASKTTVQTSSEDTFPSSF